MYAPVNSVISQNSTASMTSHTREKLTVRWDADGAADSFDTDQRPRRKTSIWNAITLLLVITLAFSVLFIAKSLLLGHEKTPTRASTTIEALKVTKPRQAETTIGPFPLAEYFQVYQPVLTPSGAVDDTLTSDGNVETTTLVESSMSESCSELLMEHVFAFSYGHPFVGSYKPPSCSFNRVVMNFTVTSAGQQYDRLAIMYFGDTEVWRTSTAEPTLDGIEWTYMKDMSEYLYFWQQPQTIIFDLGNLVNSQYTGTYNTTLTATFFNSQDSVEPAALILPVSARQGSVNMGSAFSVPMGSANNTITLPKNVNRAVFTVSACGQAAEEFWWSNSLTGDINTFQGGSLPGFSPFREVQVYIDGQLAGVQWPFPVIFTGGVVPLLWQPIVGIDAFDLREHEIDITPWLGVLCDGKAHLFEIKVAGIYDNGGTTGALNNTIGNSWIVTGKIFLWLDDSSSVTTGENPTLNVPPPVITLKRSFTQDVNGTNETLSENTAVQRQLSISSTIKTQKRTFLSSWSQTLSYSNDEEITGYGATQTNNIKTDGQDVGSGAAEFKSTYSYPFVSNQTFTIDPSGSGNFSIFATVNHGLTLHINSASVFPTGAQPYLHLPGGSSLTAAELEDTILTTEQDGTAYIFSSPTTGYATGYGTTTQQFTFAAAGTGLELYTRDVTAVNGTVTSDKEVLLGNTVGSYYAPAGNIYGSNLVAVASPKVAQGRGPGQLKPNLVSTGSG